MPELLVEFYSEEIPARMQLPAAEQLAQRSEKLLAEHGITVKQSQTYVTPQRLVLHIADLPAALPPRREEIKGPKTDAPAQAIEGFLKRYNLKDASTLQKVTMGKAEYYQLSQEIPGQNMATLLPQLIETIRREFNWPKSMRWSESSETWVRPLHHIFILFDGQVLSDTKQVFGHRFLAPQAFTPKDFADYQTRLAKQFVLLDHRARRAKIVEDANALAAQHGYQLATHDGMLDEVCGLVEYPHVKIGYFDSKNLALPAELLISVMHGHQKYFPLRDKDGKLVSAFLFTANVPGAPDDGAIINGNMRVLRARLNDAQFFYDLDLKSPLEAYLPQLSQITFHQKLGSMADKVSRLSRWVERLASYIPQADQQKALRAAQLCKADLVSGVVGEFPELQGIMGRNYALAYGEDTRVAAAIADHYQPMGPSAPVPTAPISILLALADKFDTLSEFFGIGEKPTGSKDPFALRRAALGIVRLIIHNQLNIPLAELISADLLAFIQERLRVMLRDDGLPHDILDATPAQNDLRRFTHQAQALHAFLQTDEGKAVRAAVKRALNILKAEAQKDKTEFTALSASIKLTSAIEQNLQNAIYALPAYQNYESLKALTAPLDQFFENTLVNDPDPVIRLQRLQLLAGLRDGLRSYADFNQLQG